MKKLIIPIIVGLFLLSLVSAQSININGTDYNIEEYQTIQKGDIEIYCLDIGLSGNPCLELDINGSEFIFTEDEISELASRIKGIEYADCLNNNGTDCIEPPQEPQEPLIINNSGNIIIADQYITNTPSNRDIIQHLNTYVDELNWQTDILDEDGKLNKELLFSHETTDYGSWKVDAITFTNRVWLGWFELRVRDWQDALNTWQDTVSTILFSHNDRIAELENENALQEAKLDAFEDCTIQSTTWGVPTMLERKLPSLILLFLLMLPFVIGADGCPYGENCTWYAYGVSGEDGVNISFAYEDESSSGEFGMTSLGSGKYLYTTTHNITGNIMGCARSYNASGTVATSCESKEIYEKLTQEDVGDEIEGKVILFSLIMLPLLFGIMLMVFGFSLDKETHPAIKIFLSLLSIPMFWTSLHFGVIASSQYLGFVELENAVAGFTTITGILFGAIMAYFMIYFIYTMFRYAAQKKEEKLKY